MSQVFSPNAPAAAPVFYRTYSRKNDNKLESWQQVVDRNLSMLAELGNLDKEEVALLRANQENFTSLPSGRWLWVGGTEWISSPKNFSGAYNCTSTNITDWDSFAHMMDLAMMGSGTGAVLEERYVKNLPLVTNKLNIQIEVPVGAWYGKAEAVADTTWELDPGEDNDECTLVVGDSRQGWVDSYRTLMELSSSSLYTDVIDVKIDLGHVRPKGQSLKGFGGVSNPIKLPDLYIRVAKILNGAQGRSLTPLECCLIIDEAALVVVAGNIRRSAGMRQFGSNDQAASQAKDNLWTQMPDGKWAIDPDKDALRMANHTRVFNEKPSHEVILESVTRQFYSGEGAIQYATEAIARANVDLLDDFSKKLMFTQLYNLPKNKEAAADYLRYLAPGISDDELNHRMSRYGLNPCGEIIGSDFHCNLAEVHLNLLDPVDEKAQEQAFRAAAISVASLLNHDFQVKRYQESREYDPIVGVSFTGFFDFCVKAMGIKWLEWWQEGRPDTRLGGIFKNQEASFLLRWKRIVHEEVAAYCTKRNLKIPNRCTTVQPAGTKSLLTGASPGWHPPKAQRFIRRITFGKNDPIALACIEYGYSVIPSQSDKDELGQLLDDPFDPRCTEWLVEIPTEVIWANIDGADSIDIGKFSAMAQFDFYMQVQNFYTTHNTSATIEFRQEEIKPLATAIYEAIDDNRGYISAALLSRFDANETFPRLPFEPIDLETYQRLQAAVLSRRKVETFDEALRSIRVDSIEEAGPAGCDSDKCLMPLAKK